MTVADVLGSRLYRWFRDYSAGTWTCALGSGNATQATAANRPTVGTHASGHTFPVFDGAAPPNVDFLDAGPLSTLPAYAAGDSFLFGAIVRIDSDVTEDLTVLMAINSDAGLNDDALVLTVAVAPSPGLDLAGAGQNEFVTYVDGVFRRIIVAKNGSTGVVTMHVDGVAQPVTGTGTMGEFWKTDGPTFGTQPAAPDRRFHGAMSSVFFARSSSPFSGADISDLFDAMALEITGPGGETTYTYPVTDTADDLVDGGRLLLEIADAMVDASLVETGDGNIYIMFDSPLSGGEITTLDALVAAHLGAALLGGGTGGTPLSIAAGEELVVSRTTQVLFETAIDCEGTIDCEGVLVAVR